MQMPSSAAGRLILFIVFLCLSAASPAAPRIEYFLSMDEPHTHYFEVRIAVSGHKQEFIDFKMPVWTPGSYLVREFARNVEGFTASAGNNKPVRSEKINKNTWRVYSSGADQVTVSYRVYAFEISVRTPFLDATHGYVQPAAVFMAVDKLQNQPSTLTVKPYREWKEISTGLSPAGKDKWVLAVPDYDILVDSPIEIGNQTIFSFNALGIPHTVAMYGPGNYEKDRLIQDMKTIVEETGKVVGENPNKNYTFIVHNLNAGGGGLEHLNSTTLQTTRFSYETNYPGFLSLVAHEYFHLWNVKRIRPKALGPFDYDNENYTNLLWVSEGLTAYYDDLITRRAGFYSPEQYLTVLTNGIGTIQNAPGNAVQSLAESSWDAWIKYYRPSENSNNTSISYYTKGAVIGALLDLQIMHSSNGQRSLDDVMRFLYEEYYKKQKRGFTDIEMQQAVEKVAGLNMTDFFRDYIYSTKPIDYNRYLGYAGLRLGETVRNEPFLGATASPSGGRMTVTAVQRGTSAYESGLNVNDEIIAINGYRVDSDLNRFITGKKVGERVTMMVNRAGLIQNLEVALLKNPNISYRIEKAPSATPEQEALLRKWLRI
jgi:predicted metalloprotease with PDZ domain